MFIIAIKIEFAWFKNGLKVYVELKLIQEKELNLYEVLIHYCNFARIENQ